MSSSALESIRILYIGRDNSTIEMLQQGIDSHECIAHGSIDASAKLDFFSFSNQKSALASTRAEPPNIVLVEMDGKKKNHRLGFCEMLRYRLPKAAIVAVCSKKPNTSFKFDGELRTPLKQEKTIEFLCEQATQFNGNQLEQGHITLNIAKRVVTVKGEQYHMTPKQCALLHLLMQHHDEVITRAVIMEKIWETLYLDDTRTLDVHIRWLRERIERNPSKPKYLVTKRGVGYRLSIE